MWASNIKGRGIYHRAKIKLSKVCWAGFIGTTENWGSVLIAETKAGKIIHLKNSRANFMCHCRCLTFCRARIKIEVGSDSRHKFGRRERGVDRKRLDLAEKGLPPSYYSTVFRHWKFRWNLDRLGASVNLYQLVLVVGDTSGMYDHCL